jgi:hypothetical protein
VPNTYEKVDPDGALLERSVAFAGTVHDLQLSDAASLVDGPWFAINAAGERVKLDPVPVFTEPPDDEPDYESGEPAQETQTPLDAGGQHDEPAESGDDIEE